MRIDMHCLSEIMENFCSLSSESQNRIMTDMFFEKIRTRVEQDFPNASDIEKTRLFIERLDQMKNLVELAEKLSVKQRNRLLNEARKLYTNRKYQEMCGYKMEISIKKE